MSAAYPRKSSKHSSVGNDTQDLLTCSLELPSGSLRGLICSCARGPMPQPTASSPTSQRRWNKGAARRQGARSSYNYSRHSARQCSPRSPRGRLCSIGTGRPGAVHSRHGLGTLPGRAVALRVAQHWQAPPERATARNRGPSRPDAAALPTPYRGSSLAPERGASTTTLT